MALLTGRMHSVPRAESLFGTRGSFDKTDRRNTAQYWTRCIQIVPEPGKYGRRTRKIYFPSPEREMKRRKDKAETIVIRRGEGGARYLSQRGVQMGADPVILQFGD